VFWGTLWVLRSMNESLESWLGIMRNAASIFIAIAACALVACQTPASTGDGFSTANSTASSSSSSRGARTNFVPASGPARDLSGDEAAGGHILRKHVGQTEEQLRERLERERNITGASTYTDRATAELAVGSAIAESRREIDRWIERPGRHPNLVLDYESASPIGRTMNRGENQSRPCAHALVVLKYAGPNRYYVLTSYPECR
jgi:toxin YxiD